jgi:hypothetical protein
MTTSTDAVPNASILPDGSAFAVLSFPLPQDHWLYAERTYSATDQVEPDELPAPILTHAQRTAVVAAVRYAVRGATMCGKEADFDPDALVQNAVYALCGPFGVAQPAGDWRADVQKVRDSLDPEDWCGDESMIAALDRALAQPVAPTAEQAEGVPLPSEAATISPADVQWEAHLLEVVEHTIDTLGRQLELIAERAPGKFLDKTPVVRSLTAHKQRLQRAVAERNASFAAPAASTGDQA